MKRFFVIALCIILVVSLAACTAERPANIKTENSSCTIPDSITFSDDGIWPDNEYTRGIPTPPGTIGWDMLDSEKENCSIQINGMTKAQFDSYYEQLLDSGYTEIEKVKEEVKGQGYISIGTIISNGSKSISLAYAESVLMMTIVNRGVDGSKLGFLQSSNLTNVYVNAYSTYDVEDGVQVVTELYVPEGEKPKPQFSMVNGMVTITVGDETSSFFLGTAAETEAVGLAVNSKMLGSSGDKGFVVIAGTAYADNAVVGCGSFGISYEITIP